MRCAFVSVFVILLICLHCTSAFLQVPSFRMKQNTCNYHKIISGEDNFRFGRLHRSPLQAKKEVTKEEEEASNKFVEAALEYLKKRDPKQRVRRPKMGTLEYDLYTAFADAPKFTVDFEHLAAVEERLKQEALSRGPSAQDLFKDIKRAAIDKWRRHDTDVGSSEVQVAIADERIKYLTRHMLANKHDFAAKRGMQALVVSRRKFLDHLYRSNPSKAKLMAEELGIRFRPTGRFLDKSVKYATFKNTRNKFYKTEDGIRKKVKK